MQACERGLLAPSAGHPSLGIDPGPSQGSATGKSRRAPRVLDRRGGCPDPVDLGRRRVYRASDVLQGTAVMAKIDLEFLADSSSG
jgi:hypothetical protein